MSFYERNTKEFSASTQNVLIKHTKMWLKNVLILPKSVHKITAQNLLHKNVQNLPDRNFCHRLSERWKPLSRRGAPFRDPFKPSM